MEVSYINLSNIVSAFRMDAECYQSKYIYIENLLLNMDFTLLGNEVCTFRKGIFDIKAECYTENGILFIRISDLKNCIIETSNISYIPESEHIKNKKTALKRNDLILSKTAYPAASLVTVEECNTSQDTIAVSLKKDSVLNSKYLVIFLNSKYGYLQMERWFTGNIQMHLNLSDSRNIIIPVYTQNFQNLISAIFDKSIQLREESIELYKTAQLILLNEIGLANWRPNHQISFIVNFSRAKEAERIDAEYFQPKYDEIVEAIKKYKDGWDTLGNLVKMKKGIEVGSSEYLDEGIPFIRVSNLSPFEITYEKYISEELYNRITKYQPKKGEILLSKDATPGIAYYLNDIPGKMIPSSGILRLIIVDERINGEYLTLVLNSLIIREQINRDVGGTVILHWRPEQVRDVLVPILSKEKQKEIQEKIIESSNLHRKSKQLLENVKKGVEMAIEQNEKIAKIWMKNECVKLGVEM